MVLHRVALLAYLGATCVIVDRKSFDAQALLATRAGQHITFTTLVPTHYIMMLALPDSSGGENIHPSEVESVIAAHPEVKDVAVIGVPHDKWGEAVNIAICQRPDCYTIDSCIRNTYLG